MVFSENDRAAISAAIRAAEAHTCGQIVCVLARSSSDYSAVPIQWAALLALIVPWPLIYFTQLTVQRIFLLQIVVFLIAALILVLVTAAHGAGAPRGPAARRIAAPSSSSSCAVSPIPGTAAAC